MRGELELILPILAGFLASHSAVASLSDLQECMQGSIRNSMRLILTGWYAVWLLRLSLTRPGTTASFQTLLCKWSCSKRVSCIIDNFYNLLLICAEPDANSEADVLDLLMHLLAETVGRLEGPQGTGPLEVDIRLLNVRALT